MKKLLSLFLVLCLCLSIALLSGCNNTENTDSSFVKPENYASVVRVQINPTVDLYLDGNDNILAVEFINEDAKESYSDIEQDLIGKPLDQGVSLVVEAAAEDGYLEGNNDIKIDILEYTDSLEDQQLAMLAKANSSIKATLKNKNIIAEIINFNKGQQLDSARFENFEAATPTPNADENENGTTPTPPSSLIGSENVFRPSVTQPTPTPKPTQDPNETPALTMNVQYTYFKFNDNLEMLERFAITFRPDGSFSSTQMPFSEENYGVGESIIYNGKKYYQAGGAGDGGEYSISGSTVTVNGGDIILDIISAKELKVVSSSGEDFLSPGVSLRRP